VPGTAEPGDTVRLAVAVPLGGGVKESGLKLQVAPEGQPETNRLTRLLNPLVEVTEMVDPAEPPPWMTVTEDGFAEIVKSGVGDEPQPGNLKDPIAVLQLNEPLTASYMFVYQNVQSSLGSMRRAE
jgi:hypothetical protein